jgi:cytochrome P450
MTPPIHPGWPFVGNTLWFARNPLGAFMQLQRTYERVVQISLGGRTQYVLLKPDDAKYVLQENHRNYAKSPAFRILKRFLGEGLLTSDGDFWRKQRRLAQPAFHRQKIAVLGETMLQETTAWVESLAQTNRNRPLDMSQAYMDVTMRIVCKTLFGVDAGNKLDGLSQSLDRLNQIANDAVLAPVRLPRSWPTPSNLRSKRAMRRVDDLIYGFIHERKQTGHRRDDLLDMLLYAEDEETGETMPEQQLRDECITLFAAGHETTAVSMAWTRTCWPGTPTCWPASVSKSTPRWGHTYPAAFPTWRRSGRCPTRYRSYRKVCGSTRPPGP